MSSAFMPTGPQAFSGEACGLQLVTFVNFCLSSAYATIRPYNFSTSLPLSGGPL